MGASTPCRRALQRGEIPATLIREALKEHLTKKKMSSEVFALSVGLSKPTLDSLLCGRRERIKFSSADKIISKIGGLGMWLDWPLIVFYYAVSAK